MSVPEGAAVAGPASAGFSPRKYAGRVHFPEIRRMKCFELWLIFLFVWLYGQGKGNCAPKEKQNTEIWRVKINEKVVDIKLNL